MLGGRIKPDKISLGLNTIVYSKNMGIDFWGRKTLQINKQNMLLKFLCSLSVELRQVIKTQKFLKWLYAKIVSDTGTMKNVRPL